jgi:hypothetical protein
MAESTGIVAEAIQYSTLSMNRIAKGRMRAF